MKNNKDSFEKTLNLLNKLNTKEVELETLEDRLANYCKSFIKQNIDISVEYQSSDGYVLLYSYGVHNDDNISVRDFLETVRKNNYEKIDIDEAYFL